MSLKRIEDTIHSYRYSELQSNLSTVISDIQTILAAGRVSDEEYYRNHTGRELFRRLYIFGMTTELAAIGDDYDDGFRPDGVTGIKAYGTGVTFKILAENSDPLITEASDQLIQN